MKKSNNICKLLGVGDTRKIKHVSHYLTLQQQRTIIAKMTHAHLTVLNHYFYKLGTKSFDFSDSKVAKTLGMPVRSVQRIRLDLVKAGWVYQFTYSSNKAVSTKVTVIGRESVQLYKKEKPETLSSIFAKILELEAECS